MPFKRHHVLLQMVLKCISSLNIFYQYNGKLKCKSIPTKIVSDILDPGIYYSFIKSINQA